MEIQIGIKILFSITIVNHVLHQRPGSPFGCLLVALNPFSYFLFFGKHLFGDINVVNKGTMRGTGKKRKGEKTELNSF